MRPLLLALFALSAQAQVERAVDLAEHGRCKEALPILRNAAPVKDKETQQRVGVAGVRCAMTLNLPSDAAFFLDKMLRASPHDPAVLYLATHVYSDLSTRASQELMMTNPGSAEVHQLNAEALETGGDWQHALEEYRAVAAREPNRAGIHFRIARLILSQPKGDSTFPDATRELEAELKIDPNNAGAEYVLGEIARQQEQWPAAISHFEKATKLDVGFADAFTGLGRSLLSSGRNDDAIAPLETAAKLNPDNPTTHYYAAIAFTRAGRKADSERETKLFNEASARAQQTKNDVQLGILGPQRVEPIKPQ
jgi:tetratricopeptide (TPR) repeat protein